MQTCSSVGFTKYLQVIPYYSHVLQIYETTNTDRHALLYTSNIFVYKPHTSLSFFQTAQDLLLTMKSQNNLIRKKLHCAKHLATVSTMMSSSEKRMKFFIAFKASSSIIIFDPFLLGTETCFDYLFDFFVHVNNYLKQVILYNCCQRSISLQTQTIKYMQLITK